METTKERLKLIEELMKTKETFRIEGCDDCKYYFEDYHFWAEPVPSINSVNVFKAMITTTPFDCSRKIIRKPWVPKEGDIYYVPNITNSEIGIIYHTHSGYTLDDIRIRRQLACKTEGEAGDLARAMLDFVKEYRLRNKQ